MSCPCGKAKDTAEVSQVEFEMTSKVFQAPGETTPCFLKRTGAIQQPVGEGTITPDKIATASIASSCNMKMDQKFEMTSNSLTPPSIYVGASGSETKPTRWEIELKNKEDQIINIADTGLQFDTTEGKLTGTITPEYKGKVLRANVKVFANNVSTNQEAEVDAKAYSFSVDECKADDTLKLIQPLVHPTGKIVRTSEYGEPRVGKNGAYKHTGIDYAVSGRLIGNIVAAADGVVEYSGSGRGYGTVIRIHHFNSAGKMLGETLYAHWKKSFVNAGDKVAAGQVIALEGSEGHSSGPHLHFEVKPGRNGAVDNPLNYMNGTSYKPTVPLEDPGDVSDNHIVEEKQENRGLTSAQAEAINGCSESVPIGNDPDLKDQPGGVAPDNQVFHTSVCRPQGDAGHPTKQQVIDKVNAALDRHPELDAEDRKYFLHTTKIETTYDPYAKAKGSSALGPYQMINKTAAHYYAKAGIEPTCENRCDIDKATDAMVIMYKEQKAVYDKYKATGKIAGKFPPSNAHTARYPSLTKSAFIYGLLHHDGIGNAQRGINAQGVDYYNTHRPPA